MASFDPCELIFIALPCEVFPPNITCSETFIKGRVQRPDSALPQVH